MPEYIYFNSENTAKTLTKPEKNQAQVIANGTTPISRLCPNTFCHDFKSRYDRFADCHCCERIDLSIVMTF